MIKTPKTEAENPPVQQLFQRLERLEDEISGTSHTGHSRWMIPYADLLTLLLGLFLVLVAATGTDLAEARLALSTQNKVDQATLTAPAIKDSENLPNMDMTDVSNPASEDMALEVELQEQLKNDFNGQSIEIRHQERGLVISMKDNILFAPGNAELSQEAKRTLDALALVLDSENRPIRVEGHTDNTPIQTSKFPTNWELSTARATNIVRYLIGRHHFSPKTLSAAGYGEFRPVANNSTIEGKQKNRRVDIVVLNNQTAHQEPPAFNQSATATVEETGIGED